MRIILALALPLTLIVLINAVFFDPEEGIVPIVPKVGPEPAPESHPFPHNGSPTDGIPYKYDSPPFPSPGGIGEDEPESDIGETLSNILDAVTSIISDVIGGTTTVTSAASLPTAAHPCLSAQNIYNSCASETSGFNKSAATIQASCLCYQNQNQNQSTFSWAPGLFDGFLASCNHYVQEQTQLVTLPVLKTLTAFCTTAGNVRVSTTAAVSSTPAVPTVAATTAPQELPPSKGGATVLSPVMISESRFIGWWVVIALMGLAWTGYS